MANTPQTNVKTDRSTVGTRQTVGPKSVTTQKANSSSQLAPPITATEGKAFLAGDAKSLRTPSHTLTYGRSAQGRALRAHVLGNGPDTTIIFGAFHGNEPATPGVVQRLLAYLQQHPGMLSGRRIVLAPIVNPDGLARGSRINGRGVDLNRNFPYGWKPVSKGPNYFPGKSAASEPETRAVMSLMQRFTPQKVVSIHQPLHCMNYTGVAGYELAQTMKKYNRYRITADIGYPTPGSFGDYCGKQLGIAVVTLEMPNQSAAAGWEGNRAALLAAIQHSSRVASLTSPEFPSQKSLLSRTPSSYSILVDKGDNTLSLYTGRQMVRRFKVATGLYRCTPEGKFKIIEKSYISRSGRGQFGTRWMGLNTLGKRGWYRVGIHGTNQPQTIGKYASKACVRMLNSQINQIYDLVPIGTKVEIIDKRELPTV